MEFDTTCNNPSPACAQATTAIGLNQRCADVNITMPTPDDCVNCRSLFEAAIAACGSSVCNQLTNYTHTKNVTGFWKTYHLHTRDKQNNYKYFTKLEMKLWLNNLIDLLGIH